MAFVKVRSKFQVTLPKLVRKKTRLKVGDLLEANVEGKKITLTPKSLIDRELALALEDIRRGRVHGPYHSVEEAIRALRRATK